MRRHIILLLVLTAYSCKPVSPTLPKNDLKPKVKSYWQQHLSYEMDVEVDVDNFSYSGSQKLIYTNNSPDTLSVLYYHLYYNAFQPGSAMDYRLRNIPDPDSRMIIKKDSGYISKISLLKNTEIGYIKPEKITQEGDPVSFSIEGTILKVQLNSPIPPHSKSTLHMTYKAQIPVMIRRTGRNSRGGIALSMTQWYPKPAVYDKKGWHTDPYIAREFYGEWGDFDIRIHIDKKYTVGGTGILQNPQQTGHGYEDPKKPLDIPKEDKITWHFKASGVHDFAWMADDDVIHDIKHLSNGTKLHFIYKNKEPNIKYWKEMQPVAIQGMEYFNHLIGPYPYSQYSILQGGDGGMEYPMCTLIAEKKNLKSLNGTMLHEMAHEWFYFLLANNESAYPWMDEGFASFIEGLASHEILHNKPEFIFENAYKYYRYLVESGKEEPMSTHSDRYLTNLAYGINSYDKGLIFLSQLGYITGQENLIEILRQYFHDFKGRHPYPEDFMKIAEQVSGLELDWYYNEFIESVHHVDYAIDNVSGNDIFLRKKGMTPMPLDIWVKYTDGSTEMFHIPIDLTRGHKKTRHKVMNTWFFGIDTYRLETSNKIAAAYIDPSMLMADIYREDNIFEVK